MSPAAGAQGELVGLMMIRAYHVARGNPRHKVLIPDTAHGTNPASAAFNGYSTVQLESGPDGRLHPETVAKAMDDDVAAIMITNPNTLGHLREPHRGDRRHRPRQGRPGLRGRRQLQRHPGRGPARRHGLRRHAVQPAQDLRHAARRRRSRLRPGGRRRGARALHAAPGGRQGGLHLPAGHRPGRASPHRSASCASSGATWACSSAPGRSSANSGRRGCAASPSWPC